MTDNEDLTAFDLVDLLKSDSAEDRATALEWLYPNQTVALVVHIPMTGQSGMSTCKTVSLSGLFTSLCWAAEKVGDAIGFKLGWVGKPVDDKKLVVPSGVIRPGG